MTPMQEAVLDLGVEQVLSPALAAVNNAFVQTMIEHGIPIEAIVTELVLSGEVERTYRLLREVGYAVQSEFHSPTSQYGQLTRRGRYDHLDFLPTMRELTDDIESGRFADEWDAERDAGYPTLNKLKEQHAGRRCASTRPTCAAARPGRQAWLDRPAPPRFGSRSRSPRRRWTRARGTARTSRRGRRRTVAFVAASSTRARPSTPHPPQRRPVVVVVVDEQRRVRVRAHVGERRSASVDFGLASTAE